MSQFKMIHAFKVLLYGLGVLLPLATFSPAQEVNSQVGAPIGGVDQTVQAGVHAEVTGQPTGPVSPRPQVAASGSTTSGEHSLTKSASGTPSARLPQSASTPKTQSEPMFMPNPASNGASTHRHSNLTQSDTKPVTRVSTASGGSSSPQSNVDFAHPLSSRKHSGTHHRRKSHKLLASAANGNGHDHTRIGHSKTGLLH
jgi:hypothetical protein